MTNVSIFSLLDIDECSEQKNLCAFRCYNLQGTYQCTCPKGFQLSDDGKHCEDINECDTPFICPFRCKNIVGGFRCLCPEGYTRDPVTGECQGNVEKDWMISATEVYSES